jgi:predicted DNA-binding transcriptional regulator AlpA
MQNNPGTIEPLLVRAKEASRLCGVSPRKWADLQASGQIPPAYRLGGCVVWKLEDIRLWIQYDMPCLDLFEQIKGANNDR